MSLPNPLILTAVVLVFPGRQTGMWEKKKTKTKRQCLKATEVAPHPKPSQHCYITLFN